MRTAIIGGGIVGLYLAQKLSLKSEVFLFEKKIKLGEKACSCLVSERIFDFLPEAKNFVENKINFCTFYFPKKEIKLEFKKNFFAISRKKLENFLLEDLKKRGVKIFLGKKIEIENFREIEKDFDRIIGADGAHSVVRKYLGKKPKNFVVGIKSILEKKDFSNFAKVWPTKEGFLWQIPRGDKIEYGIIEKGKRAKKLFDSFKEKLGLSFEKENLAPILIDYFLPKTEKITLCGEAAGMVKPWSGGGIIWGLKGAQILIENFPDFLKYKAKADSFFKKQIFISKIAKSFVYFFGFKLPFFLFKKFSFDGDFF